MELPSTEMQKTAGRASFFFFSGGGGMNKKFSLRHFGLEMALGGKVGQMVVYKNIEIPPKIKCLEIEEHKI